MNLTDLSTELQTRAEDLNTGAAMARLAGVRGRVQARRRRRAAAAVLVVAGCVAALVIGPNLSVLHATHSTAPAGQHRIKAFTFDDVLAGDPLIASAVGVKGQRSVELRFTPTDTYLSLSDFCYLPRDTSDLVDNTTVNGHPFLGSSCQNSTVANGSSGTPASSADQNEADQNRAGWAEMGVVPGRESVIRIELQAGKDAPRSDPSVRLGIGVYALTGDRVVSDGQVIKLDAESNGHDYRLVKYITTPVSPQTRQVSLPLPAQRRPVYVASGTVDTKGKDWKKETDLLLDGQEHSSSNGGGWGGEALDDSKAHTLTVRTKSSTGVLLLAYYVRVD
jgi:hypothetical protein